MLNHNHVLVVVHNVFQRISLKEMSNLIIIMMFNIC